MAAAVDTSTKSGLENQSELKPELGELNEEQKKFILECEEEFSNRYTDDDPDYIKSKTMSDSDRKEPPIIAPWYSKPPRRREHDWDRRNRDRDRDRDRDDRYHRRGGRHHMQHRNSRFY